MLSQTPLLALLMFCLLLFFMLGGFFLVHARQVRMRVLALAPAVLRTPFCVRTCERASVCAHMRMARLRAHVRAGRTRRVGERRLSSRCGQVLVNRTSYEGWTLRAPGDAQLYTRARAHTRTHA